MRLGELLNMKWNWIDLPNKLITIKCSDKFSTKSKKERILPMNETVFHTLSSKNSIANVNDFVFSKRIFVKHTNDYVSKNFKKSVRAAGQNDNIHFHTLRHSFASLLVQKGVSLYVVKELPGHEDLTTTQIYSYLQHQNLKVAVNIL